MVYDGASIGRMICHRDTRLVFFLDKSSYSSSLEDMAAIGRPPSRLSCGVRVSLRRIRPAGSDHCLAYGWLDPGQSVGATPQETGDNFTAMMCHFYISSTTGLVNLCVGKDYFKVKQRRRI